MRNAILFFTLTIFTVQFGLAQDIIVKRDQQEIQAKIIEIGQDQIKYRKKDHLDGPIYNIAKAEVFMILYQNGKLSLLNR